MRKNRGEAPIKRRKKMKPLPHFSKAFYPPFLEPSPILFLLLRCILLVLIAYQREINLLISQFKEAEKVKVEKLGLARNIFRNANRVVVGRIIEKKKFHYEEEEVGKKELVKKKYSCDTPVILTFSTTLKR